MTPNFVQTIWDGTKVNPTLNYTCRDREHMKDFINLISVLYNDDSFNKKIYMCMGLNQMRSINEIKRLFRKMLKNDSIYECMDETFGWIDDSCLYELVNITLEKIGK